MNTRPEWDTPPDGDFARYVERLTAPPASPETAARPARADLRARHAPADAAAPALLRRPAPDLAHALAPLHGVLRAGRSLLLVLWAVHGAALFFLGWGSLAGLAAMGAVWWGLGRLLAAAPQAVRARSRAAGALAGTLHERLQHLAGQRKTPRKKPQ